MYRESDENFACLMCMLAKKGCKNAVRPTLPTDMTPANFKADFDVRKRMMLFLEKNGYVEQHTRRNWFNAECKCISCCYRLTVLM